MSDFYQNGVITTLHRLGASSLGRIEAELKHYARERPMALVLPCLHTEIDGSGLRGILEVLREVSYLHRIIVSVSGTTTVQAGRSAGHGVSRHCSRSRRRHSPAWPSAPSCRISRRSPSTARLHR